MKLQMILMHTPGGAEGCKAGKIGVQCKWGKIALGTRSAVYFKISEDQRSSIVKMTR